MYEWRVLTTWWEYSSLLIIALLLSNGLIFGIASSEPTWWAGFAEVSDDRRGSAIYVLICGIGPLINLFIWRLFSRFTVESEDDVMREKLFEVSRGRRTRLLRFASMFWGFMLLPPFVWPYTFHLRSMWGTNQEFWFQPGQLIFGIAGMAFVLIIPKVFPGSVVVADNIVNGISKKLMERK